MGKSEGLIDGEGDDPKNGPSESSIASKKAKAQRKKVGIAYHTSPYNFHVMLHGYPLFIAGEESK